MTTIIKWHPINKAPTNVQVFVSGTTGCNAPNDKFAMLATNKGDVWVDHAGDYLNESGLTPTHYSELPNLPGEDLGQIKYEFKILDDRFIIPFETGDGFSSLFFSTVTGYVASTAEYIRSKCSNLSKEKIKLLQDAENAKEGTLQQYETYIKVNALYQKLFN